MQTRRLETVERFARYTQQIRLTRWERLALEIMHSRLTAREMTCPVCEGNGKYRAWDDVDCAGCDGTGLMNLWYLQTNASEFWDNCGVDEESLSISVREKESMAFLHQRLSVHRVTCPLCGDHEREGNPPCPLCGRQKTVDAWTALTTKFVPCPHCNGAGLGGVIGNGWDCPICCLLGSVPFWTALDYSPDCWWETIRPFITVDAGIAEVGSEAFADHQDMFNMRDEAGPGSRWPDLDLTDADMSGLDLRDSTFDGSQFFSLDDCNLSNCSLVGATIGSARNADFTDAYLCGANLEGANLTGSTIHRATSLEDTILANVTGLTKRQRWICGEKGAIWKSPDAWEDDDDL